MTKNCCIVIVSTGSNGEEFTILLRFYYYGNKFVWVVLYVGLFMWAYVRNCII